MTKLRHIKEDLPLEQLMHDLRAAGLGIGVGDFQEAQEALQYGLAGETAEDLRNLLRMLWLTSVEDFPLFDHHFDHFITAAQSASLPPINELEGLPNFSIENPTEGVRGLDPNMEENAKEEEAPAEMPEVDGENVEEEAAIQLQEGKSKYSLAPTVVVRQHDPIRPLELRRSWQKLKVEGKIYSRMELDLKPTIKEIARKGYFDGPVLKPRSLRSLNLVLLFDRGGSMTPMHDFCDRWKETLLRNVQVRQYATGFFRNCPTNEVFSDPYLLESIPLSRFLKAFAPRQTVVLLVTDAGAARQSWNTRRIMQSQRLSRRLMRDGYHQLWLNPMGQDFWDDNSARKISTVVPEMFTMDAKGTRRTIQFLNLKLRRLEV